MTLAFFEIGFAEMVTVALVALLLFGGRLPEMMRSFGRAYRGFRKGLDEFKDSAMRATGLPPGSLEPYRPTGMPTPPPGALPVPPAATPSPAASPVGGPAAKAPDAPDPRAEDATAAPPAADPSQAHPGDPEAPAAG